MLKCRGFGEIIHRILCYIRYNVVTLLTEKQKTPFEHKASELMKNLEMMPVAQSVYKEY